MKIEKTLCRKTSKKEKKSQDKKNVAWKMDVQDLKNNGCLINGD